MINDDIDPYDDIDPWLKGIIPVPNRRTMGRSKPAREKAPEIPRLVSVSVTCAPSKGSDEKRLNVIIDRSLCDRPVGEGLIMADPLQNPDTPGAFGIMFVEEDREGAWSLVPYNVKEDGSFKAYRVQIPTGRLVSDLLRKGKRRMAKVEAVPFGDCVFFNLPWKEGEE